MTRVELEGKSLTEARYLSLINMIERSATVDMIGQIPNASYRVELEWTEAYQIVSIHVRCSKKIVESIVDESRNWIRRISFRGLFFSTRSLRSLDEAVDPVGPFDTTE